MYVYNGDKISFYENSDTFNRLTSVLFKLE